MTNDEIEKLAREYAEEQLESLKVYLSEQPEPLKVANDISSQSTASMYVNFLNWLLRTHYIVGKEKVRKLHTALSKDKSGLKNWEEREIFSARISMPNHLFGRDLFIDDDGRI